MLAHFKDVHKVIKPLLSLGLQGRFQALLGQIQADDMDKELAEFE